MLFLFLDALLRDVTDQVTSQETTPLTEGNNKRKNIQVTPKHTHSHTLTHINTHTVSQRGLVTVHGQSIDRNYLLLTHFYTILLSKANLVSPKLFPTHNVLWL